MILEPGIAVDTLLSRLPEPDEVDSDDDETIYEFWLDEIVLELECSLDGEVLRVNLYREPD